MYKNGAGHSRILVDCRDNQEIKYGYELLLWNSSVLWIDAIG